MPRIASLLAIAIACLMGASVAHAADMYGALAYDSSSGAYGWAVDHRTQRGANADAMRRCGGSCSVVMRFWNSCAAFASGSRGVYGWADSQSGGRAQQAALNNCAARGRNCAVKVWACTSR